ncbi:MAG: hypothetical protein BWY31_02352 [Lentisphaerae bacterium ADurb.Bin242]|nr:MAG: hypothetical protein BWY31_02352 [Lentisphaerae bacterium ADurb.Bin242]
MKKLLVALFFGMGMLNCFAAFQYEVVKSPTAGQWSDGGPGNGVYGYAFYVRVTEGTGTIYLLDKINNVYSMSGNNELLSLKADMAHYGYVDSTGTSHAGTGDTITTYAKQYPYNEMVTQTGYALGEFSAGDEIGVWLTVNGTTGASVLNKSNSINSSNMNYRDAYVGTDILGNNLFQLDFTSGGSVFFGISGVASSPSGQPLPGILATLLLGGGLMAWRMRRKKA